MHDDSTRAGSTGDAPRSAAAPGRDRRTFMTGAVAVAGGGLAAAAAAASPQEAGRNIEGGSDSAPATSSSPAPEPRPFESPLTADDVRAAGRVVELPLTDTEIEPLIRSLEQRRAALRSARREPMPNDLAPAETFRPPGLATAVPGADVVRRTRPASGAPDPGPRPAADVDVAFSSIRDLGTWIRRGELSSRELTDICLARIARHDPALEAVITVTADLARSQADAADRDLAAGRDRGPLHGIPYGAKDLFDTAGIATTWGAAPYADRVADRDAAVVTRLRKAGAVLVAKTSLGALAYGDIWHRGRTNNPWNLDQGSSGSSAGSSAGVAAGLFPFALGTETYGSIVSPSMRCGTTGLRPTFGRVARTGAMALCWSLDKVGPIARRVEDTALVLAAIDGSDAGDPSSVDLPFDFDAGAELAGLTVGVDLRWFEGRGTSDADRAALAALRAVAEAPGGPEIVEIDGPSADGAGRLLPILEAEAAAAFQELTLTDEDDRLTWQAPQAWPSTFRGAHFHSAVDLIQAMRERRRVAERMEAAFAGVDAMLSPAFAGGLLLMTNFSGHPCLVMRAGFAGDRPRGVCLWGRLGGDAALARLGMALEAELGVADRRPPVFGD